ncbi:hypothetical protein SDC9_62150 [bioreactor metagenome]|uniref:Flagellar FliJ protein n=1 Tax=bioreactor metagenome TaxID=1076179 RepID=A0A644XIZ7_9ZZZZ
MKRFVFSLDALFELKKNLKDKIQAEYAQAEAALDKALCVKVALDKVYMDENERYEQKAQRGITAADAGAHVIYFDELQQAIATATEDVMRAQDEANRKQGLLLEIHKEIKTLEKLRRKQYLEYLAEEEKQEANARDELVAFSMAEQAAADAGCM